MSMAAYRGHIEKIQWLHEHQAKVTKDAMDSAIIAGHLEIIKWLHNIEVNCDSRMHTGTILPFHGF